MSRLLAIVAATAAAASVAAIITLPAGADDPGAADAKFITCLRAHGLDIPAGTREPDIKDWIVAHHDGNTDTVLRACKLEVGGSTEPPANLVACLHDHGLDAPASSINDFKGWMVEQSKTDAGKAAQSACGIEVGPETDHARGDKEKGPAGCAPEPAKPEEKQPQQ
jgi:hypothetical protein